MTTHSLSNVSPSDGEWGRLNSTTGLWTGLVGDLESGRADLCASSLTMTGERLRSVDFSTAIMEDVMTPFVANPESMKGHSGAADVNLAVFITVFTYRYAMIAIYQIFVSIFSHSIGK